MEIEHSTSNERLNNMNRFISHAPPGIILEVGVWKGGSLRFLAENHPKRRFIGIDTFEGMPAHGEFDNYHRRGDFGNTSFEEVVQNTVDLPNVTLVKGEFSNLNIAISEQCAMIHCDVDLYESTIAVFRRMEHRVVHRGRIYCDDAFQPTCEGATLALCEFVAQTKRIPRFDDGMHVYFEF